MRLAKERREIPRLGKLPGKPSRPDRRVKIDAVVVHAMRQRQQPGQDRRPRRLAHRIGRDAVRQIRAGLLEMVEMRRPHLASPEPVAIAALLIGGDEKDVRT